MTAVVPVLPLLSTGDLERAMAPGALRTVFQPIVALAGAPVVAWEALCRGPVGSVLERPDLLFDAARRVGRTAELDAAAREVALTAVLAAGIRGPATLFLNAEPEGLAVLPEDALAAQRAQLEAVGVRVVLEVTERALTAQPGELLRALDRVREWGWAIAVDDVGAERASLALLPLLAPDVVKLDLRLVQQRTTADVAEIVNAVRAHAERTGALILAEGIETEEHEELARSLGADYGQGWLYGRPAPLTGQPVEATMPLPGCRAPELADTPWRAVSADAAHLRRAHKPLLVAMSKTLERQALAGGEASVVLGTFQHQRFFTRNSAARYQALASSVTFVGALATGMSEEPAPGVRGTALDADDPLVSEWDLAVVGPHFAAALVALDLGDGGPEEGRRFDYLLTYDRDTALAVAASLLARVRSQTEPRLARPYAPAPVFTAELPAVLDGLLHRAVQSSQTGITVADARLPDTPLVFVNNAFERLSGYRTSEAVGRNCRFLQGPATDRDAVRLIHEQLRSGRQVTTTLVNVRPDGSSWHNELSINPVVDEVGLVTHFIGIQTDVTARVRAQEQLSYLASHDPLTGLFNRAELLRRLEAQLERSRLHGTRTGLLFLDLDGFKSVNDRFGHAAGDALLVELAALLRRECRRGDLVGRLGGDEFAVILEDLDVHGADAADTVLSAAVRRITNAVSELSRAGLGVRASVGRATFPDAATDADGLLAHADLDMYAVKAARRGPARQPEPTPL